MLSCGVGSSAAGVNRARFARDALPANCTPLQPSPLRPLHPLSPPRHPQNVARLHEIRRQWPLGAALHSGESTGWGAGLEPLSGASGGGAWGSAPRRCRLAGPHPSTPACAALGRRGALLAARRLTKHSSGGVGGAGVGGAGVCWGVAGSTTSLARPCCSPHLPRPRPSPAHPSTKAGGQRGEASGGHAGSQLAPAAHHRCAAALQAGGLGGAWLRARSSRLLCCAARRRRAACLSDARYPLL